MPLAPDSHRPDGPPLELPDGPDAAVSEAIARLPASLRGPTVWVLGTYPGRILLRTADGCLRIEIFDRAMTIAAQFFTSIVPLLILAGVVLSRNDSSWLANALAMPPAAQSVLADSIGAANSTTFGLAGLLFVIVSSTSLSRALTRAYAAVWRLPRPHTQLRAAWRWVAVVLSLALTMLLLRWLARVAATMPYSTVWEVLGTAVLWSSGAVIAPWLLMASQLPARLLIPGGLVLGCAMTAAAPITEVYLSRALETSTQRYGAIGLTFAYLSWLYIVSFALLLSALLGQSLVTDDGWLGRVLRGPLAVPGVTATGVAAESTGTEVPPPGPTVDGGDPAAGPRHERR
jgi:membrane protein